MDMSLIVPVLPMGDINLDKMRSMGSQPVRLEQACREFEVLLSTTMLSSMIKTRSVDSKTGLQGMQENWAWNLMIQTVARELSQGQGLGLGKLLNERLETQTAARMGPVEHK